jgi:hypothetical protein
MKKFVQSGKVRIKSTDTFALTLGDEEGFSESRIGMKSLCPHFRPLVAFLPTGFETGTSTPWLCR